jgi:hypothetical protein
MDEDQMREFGQMIDNLGNPNDLVREKHTADLLRAIQLDPLNSMLLSIGIVFGTCQLIKALQTSYRRKPPLS